MKHTLPQAGRQSGVMLIEALIALLIFSIGILGIVGLQSSAVTASSDAKYRSEAALLANELIGQMWAGNRTQAALQAAYLSSNSAAYNPADKTTYCRANGGANGAAYEQWAWIGSNAASPGTTTAPATGTVLRTLPGAMANPPTVVIVSSGAANMTVSSIVTITICWQAPNEATVHNYIAEARIGG